MAYLIDIRTFKDSRGSLSVLESEIPFTIKRVYYISGVPDPVVVRAGHRHKINIQALICVNGSCIISNDNGKEKEEFILDNQEKCLILMPEDWHTMHHFTQDAVLLVLASELYDSDDYVDEPYS